MPIKILSVKTFKSIKSQSFSKNFNFPSLISLNYVNQAFLNMKTSFGNLVICHEGLLKNLNKKILEALK